MRQVRGMDCIIFFFFNDTATTEIYTLSLHDALPIWRGRARGSRGPRSARPTSPSCGGLPRVRGSARWCLGRSGWGCRRSEEHTSELQSRQYLVCRLLLEKKKKISTYITVHDAYCDYV